MTLKNQINEALEAFRKETDFQPEIALILGSGLGDLANEIDAVATIPFSLVPHMPVSTVAGHDGQFVLGTLKGKKVVAMQGRIHFYEGYTMHQVTFPVRLMHALGAEKLIVTNASGGLNPSFEAGYLMFIEDHINFFGDNPLIGPNDDEVGPRFPDMSQAYSQRLNKLGKEIADEFGIDTVKGVHSAITGPSYLSPAELKMIRNLGADTVGMSTIPEVIVAVHCGMEILGICCITDMAVPEEGLEPLDHATVVEVANRTKPKFIKLVSEILNRM